MKKQAYKIQKQDWLVTVKKNTTVWHRYFKTRSEANEWGKTRCKAGVVQVFKISYEFKDILINNN